MRYKLTLRWLGTHYCGWQVQPNAPTICGAVQDAVERLFGERGELTGCSRTDSGVHAVGFVAALKCEGCRIPPEALQWGILHNGGNSDAAMPREGRRF